MRRVSHYLFRYASRADVTSIIRNKFLKSLEITFRRDPVRVNSAVPNDFLADSAPHRPTSARGFVSKLYSTVLQNADLADRDPQINKFGSLLDQ